VLDRATWLNLAQGPVQQTGNPLDVALSDNAFLTVQTPNGERYTRNGALQINATGQLVTSEGLQVIGQNGPIIFQAGDRNVAISTDGHDLGARGQQHHRLAARQAAVASFDQAQRLEKDGTSTYMAPAGMQAQGAGDGARRAGRDREIERQRRAGNDPHGRGDPHLHPGRRHAAAAERHAPQAIEKLAEVPA
jgi:flagellar basal body rod protein FlgG